MASRLKATVVRRPSLPLTEADELELTRIKESPQVREALGYLIDVPFGEGPVSEAALLHAVFEAGLGAVRGTIEDAGYAMIAREQARESLEQQAFARRRLPTWADEA
jgi:hypothetical protein